MAKNLGGQSLLYSSPLAPFYTGKAVQNSGKSLGGDIPNNSSSQTSYYLAGSLCCRFFI
jgi:hypothetical protein